MGKKRTTQEIEEIVIELGYVLLDISADESGKRRVLIRDEDGYKYNILLGNLMGLDIIPSIVDPRRPDISLENISLWLQREEKTFELCDNNEYNGNKEPLWFHCFICGENFDTNWAMIYSRGDGCSYCSNNRVSDKNRLSVVRSDISSEWDYKLNADTPEDVSYASDKIRWWICSAGHPSYPSPIKDRTRGRGCSYCARKRISNDNRLSYLYKEISSEWNHELNSDTPDDVSYGSNEGRWWICPNGHESYFAKIGSRTNMGSGCPVCSSSTGEEEIAKWLNYNGIIYIPEKRFDDCRNKRQLPFDFGIPYENGNWFLIEFHGGQHYFSVKHFGGEKTFKEQQKKDKIKLKYCQDNNIPLLVIPYWEFDNIESILKETLSI